MSHGFPLERLEGARHRYFECRSRLVNAVLNVLRREHAELRELLGRLVFETAQMRSLALVPDVCREILLHCTVEAGVLIPAIAELDGGDELLRKTGSEFALITGLISELLVLGLADCQFASILDELRDRVLVHIKLAEAPGGLLERAGKLTLEWHNIGKNLVERRQQLCKNPTAYVRLLS